MAALRSDDNLLLQHCLSFLSVFNEHPGAQGTKYGFVFLFLHPPIPPIAASAGANKYPGTTEFPTILEGTLALRSFSCDGNDR